VFLFGALSMYSTPPDLTADSESTVLILVLRPQISSTSHELGGQWARRCSFVEAARQRRSPSQSR
jgi:hypothetical protein